MVCEIDVRVLREEFSFAVPYVGNLFFLGDKRARVRSLYREVSRLGSLWVCAHEDPSLVHVFSCLRFRDSVRGHPFQKRALLVNYLVQGHEVLILRSLRTVLYLLGLRYEVRAILLV